MNYTCIVRWRHICLTFVALIIYVLPGRVVAADDTVSHQSSSRVQTWFWAIEGGKAPLWVLGSIHCGKPELYPLPDAIERALAGAEVIALENYTTTYTESENARLAPLLAPVAHMHLNQVVSATTYAAVQRSCALYSIPDQAVDGYRPLVVGMLLGMRAAAGDGLDFQLGVDNYVLAKRNGREIIRLEDFDIALKRIQMMSPHLEEVSLIAALDDVVPGRAQSLYEVYRTGAIQEMNRILTGFAASLPEVDRIALRQLTVDDRNTLIARELRKVLAGGKGCFAVIGVAHLLGDNSVLSQLAKDGFHVKLVEH